MTITRAVNLSLWTLWLTLGIVAVIYWPAWLALVFGWAAGERWMAVWQ